MCIRDRNSGIVFKRTDLNQNNIVIPNFANVSDATLCTTVSNQFGVKVSTIEHLMAAFLGLGIDNAIVELDSQEVPILDGSARDFVKILKETGLKNSDVPIKLIKINNHVELEDGDKYISIDKSNTTLEIEFEINYQNKVINNQKNKVNVFEEQQKISDQNNNSDLQSKILTPPIAFGYNLSLIHISEPTRPY